MWRALQIYHVNVNCTNLERSLEFYRGLGFEEVYDIPDCRVPGLGPVPQRGRAKLLRFGTDPRGALLDLIEWTEPPTDGTPYPHLAHAGIARICLRVKGLDELIAELRARGVRFVDEPAEPGLLGYRQKFVCVLDPDGSVIELMEFF
jgi:catechol 2,3-dioxygenase-like lactoylglutathione lyase family enzyme